MATGVVTTARITHATPASAFAYSADRNWEADSNISPECNGAVDDIALQMLEYEDNRRMQVTLHGCE